MSEFDERIGAPDVGAAIKRLAPRVVGQPVGEHERMYAELYAITRPATGVVISLTMGAIENALLDAKAKTLGVLCYELLGGKIRDRIRVYWSNSASYRKNQPKYFKPQITDFDGDRAMGYLPCSQISCDPSGSSTSKRTAAQLRMLGALRVISLTE